MLSSFRSISKTWFGKILGAFLIVGLMGFGISSVLFQFGAGTVATVAGEDISVRDFQIAYQRQLSEVAQQIGRLPTNEEALAFGVPGMVIDGLGREAAVNKLGQDLGLGVSEERLGQMLRDNPNFANPLGAFDRDLFVQVLRQSGYTEAQYFDLQTKDARRQQLQRGLFAGSPTPAVAADLIGRYSDDTRTVEYFVLNAQALPPVAEPTEEELAAFLAEHQPQFRTQETRTVDLLALTLDSLAATKTVTDEEIAAEYERTRDNRVKQERRTISQVALTTPEQVTAFEAGLTGGTPFADLVAAAGLTVSNLGTLAKSGITDAALADAAFGVEPGGFAIIEGIGGKRAVHVSAVEPGGEIGLADSRDEIAQQLALTQARSEYIDILDQIEELRAAFRPLSEIAERFGLETRSVALTATGTQLEAVPELAVEERPRVASAVFAAEQGELAPTVALSSNRNFWFDLRQVDVARDQTLDEVRDTVAAGWTDQKTAEALTAEVTRITDQLEAGTPFADVAAGLNQFASLSQPLKRSGDGTPILNQTVASAIFAGGPTHFGSAVNSDGDHVVFQVVEVTPAGEVAADVARFAEDSAREGLYGDFVAGLKDEAGIRINQQALNQLLSTAP